LQGLASYLGDSAENYVYDIEPYLLRNGLIIRTPRGRKITEKGKTKIEELTEEIPK
jgi:holliday junction DNA helicase RuvB